MSAGMGGPYVGSRPFHTADQQRFCGRQPESGALADLWRTNRLTLLNGPVASGKTSLLQAGVLPLVRGRRHEVLPPGSISAGATFPAAALPEHNPYTLALLRSWTPGEAPQRLAGLTVGEFIRRRADQHNGAILAVIDQAEEMLVSSGPRQAYRRRFFGQLVEAMQAVTRFHLLVMTRDDALDLMTDALGGGARCQLKPLSPESAFEAVTIPAAGTGRTFEADAAEEIVTAVQTSRIGPAGAAERYVVDERVQPELLQVVCARLWDALPAECTVISKRDVRRCGNADHALAAHYGQIIATIADEHDMPTARLRSWLLATLVTELGTRDSVYEGFTETAGVPNTVVRALEDRHLLTTELRSGARWHELLSDRLIEPLRLSSADEQPPAADAPGYLRTAERALAIGELDRAAKYAQVCLRTAAGTDLRLRAEADSFLGNVADEREKPGEAETHYRKAARLFAAAGDTGAVARQLAAVGQMLVAQGRLAEAVDELRAAIERMPNDPTMKTELGQALWQLGQGQAAVAVLNSVLGIDGGNPEALRTRGEILAYLGEARSALVDLNRVKRHDRPSSRAARGLALAELGDYSAADQEIKNALAEAPRNGPVLLYAARATALGGDKASAKELAMRAVDASDPSLSPQHRHSTLELLAGGLR
jgi:tetratricopeptide (TPR) repeat protein